MLHADGDWTCRCGRVGLGRERKADLPELRKRSNDDADEHIQDKVVRDRKEYDGVAARPV